MSVTITVDVGYALHDADWYLANSRGEFSPEREVIDDGELGMFYAPVPVETVQLSETPQEER